MENENENENFDGLKKLLALKKHELPPPGYFNKLPGHVLASIRRERAGNLDAMTKLNTEAPWLMRFWQSLEAKPMFAGAFGAAICAIVLGAIVFAEKPATQPRFAGPQNIGSPLVSGAPVEASAGFEQPVLMAATNQTGPNLFEMVPDRKSVV